MIDESMDREQMKKPPQPWEFRSKPAWQRLIVMLGGVIMNVILGVLIFTLSHLHYTESYVDISRIEEVFTPRNMRYNWGSRKATLSPALMKNLSPGMQTSFPHVCISENQ